MSTLTLEDVIIEAATELAISGECDLPMSNVWGGVDLVAPGYFESGPAYREDGLRQSWSGVRIAIEDGSIQVFKFEGACVLTAVATFKGEMVSASVLAAVVKGWI